PGDEEQHRPRDVGEHVLPEKDSTYERQVADPRDRKTRHGAARDADKSIADERRQAETEERQRQAGGNLVSDEDKGEEREQERDDQAAECGRDNPYEWHAGEVGGGEADDRADRHHSLNAEVEDPGALGHQFAKCCQEKRRRGGYDREDRSLKPL